jgi:hypothetical protein
MKECRNKGMNVTAFEFKTIKWDEMTDSELMSWKNLAMEMQSAQYLNAVKKEINRRWSND